MSDFLRLSVLSSDHQWPVLPASYPYQYEQLTQAPDWEHDCIDGHSLDLYGPAWGVFCRTCVPLLPPDECTVLQPYLLMMFNGATAQLCAQRLSPLPPAAQADIDRLVQENSPWTAEEIRRAVLSIKNALARWLRKLPDGQVGAIRLYDWGKY